MEDYPLTSEFHAPSSEEKMPIEVASPIAPSTLITEPTKVQEEFSGKSGGAESETAKLHKLVKRLMLLPTATALATASLFFASAGVDPLKDDFLSQENYFKETAKELSLLAPDSVLMQGGQGENAGSHKHSGNQNGPSDGSQNPGGNDTPGGPGSNPGDEDPTQGYIDEDGEAYVHNMQEAREFLSQGIHRLNLVSDFVIDLDADMLAGAEFICHGYRMTVIGIWRDFQIYGDQITGIEIKDASHVDLSGMSIDPDSFDQTQNPGMVYSVVAVTEKEQSRVTLPSGYVTREQMLPLVAPFEAFCCYEFAIDGQPQVNVCYVSPDTTYEALQKLETQAVYDILTKGHCRDVIDTGESNDLRLYTDITVNIGNSTLPGTNIMFMSLWNGASLRLSGTLTVTGNSTECTPRISVRSGSYLDISGLSLINNHPYSDVFIVDVVESGANTSGLNPRAAAGALRVEQNGNSIVFCID
ncbi:MAG: hypothetical protein J5546_09165 [Lachnospiraceae bacterium]|nr:hypothetical protein [Lachnospiraceae bacterium]